MGEALDLASGTAPALGQDTDCGRHPGTGDSTFWDASLSKVRNGPREWSLTRFKDAIRAKIGLNHIQACKGSSRTLTGPCGDGLAMDAFTRHPVPVSEETRGRGGDHQRCLQGTDSPQVP